MFSIAVLSTCYNRKNATLLSIRKIFSQIGLNCDFKLKLFLVDDGSDGTKEQVSSHFPDVLIIPGTGFLYWNRGMHLAWETAVKFADFDFYLWLNDDTFLFPDAIKALLQFNNSHNITCGTTKSHTSMNPTYGGYTKGKILCPNGKCQEADYCNGNCVLIPKAVFEKVGNLDSYFHHALGDFDYTLRAARLGVKILVCSKFIGFCEPHMDKPVWRNYRFSIYERIKNLYSPKSGCHPIEYFRFDNRHYGLLSAVYHFLTIHLKVILPKLVDSRKLNLF